MAFQHAGEAVAHFGGGLAHHDGAGDVGGAVGILRAAVQQEHLARIDGAVGRTRHTVMHDGAIAARAGNGVERHVAEHASGAAETFQSLGGIDLGQGAAGGMGFEPGQIARQCRAVADMRLAHAFDFEAVLAGLGQLAGIGPLADFRVRPGQAVEDGGGGRRRVHQHALALHRIQRGGEGAGLVHLHRISQMG